MKEYKVFETDQNGWRLEGDLNDAAREGFAISHVIDGYRSGRDGGSGAKIIMERDTPEPSQ